MENYARPKERDWNVLRTFNSLYGQFAEFRTFVRSQQAALRSQDTQQLSGLIASAQQESLNNARALHARRLELQAALSSITQNVEGVDSEMLHFRMYGPQPGQSFHEQFRGSTANAVTMTLGSSFGASRDYERQETLRVCNLTISALSVNAADPTINAGLAQKRTDVTQLGQFRLNVLAASTTVEDIVLLREQRYLRGMNASVVEFLRAQGAAIAPAPGRFAAPASTGTLQTDLATAIAENDRGANPFGRDAKKRNKRNLRDIKQVVDALHTVFIYE
jgi:hypothetical protein